MVMVAMAIFISGCGEPKIDGTSEETYTSSIEVIKAALTEADRTQLDRALEGFEYLFSETYPH